MQLYSRFKSLQQFKWGLATALQEIVFVIWVSLFLIFLLLRSGSTVLVSDLLIACLLYYVFICYDGFVEPVMAEKNMALQAVVNKQVLF